MSQVKLSSSHLTFMLTLVPGRAGLGDECNINVKEACVSEREENRLITVMRETGM